MPNSKWNTPEQQTGNSKPRNKFSMLSLQISMNFKQARNQPRFGRSKYVHKLRYTLQGTWSKQLNIGHACKERCHMDLTNTEGKSE